ncbi:MAG: hypothetical protein IT329_08140 [Caldilineaceae bacterium]|nr:hypothetical protein [Caldilineaceae bacterium]
MKQHEEEAQASPPDDALIANPSRPPVRLRGSHSSQQPFHAVAGLRRRRDDDGEPFPDEPPPPPPPPPPPVSTPDLAFQIAFCLPAELDDAIESSIAQALDPNADVRTACVNGTQRIGVWLRPFVNEQDNQARTRGLERLNILGGGEALTFFINSALIRRQALEGWNQAPKRLNGDGDPDPGGPVHLTGFSVSFQSPNRVVTRVDGFDERPWPDVDFQLTTTDTLSLSGGQVQCSSQRDLDVDTSWLNFLTGLFLIVLPPLGIVFLVERIIIASADAPKTDAGAGCGAATLIPQEILIPGGQKVVVSYSRLEVSGGGIFAGGSFVVIPRSPEVTITGPSQISVVEGTASVTRSYSLRIEDLRPTLQTAWSGEGSALNSTTAKTSFRFNLAGAQAGQVLTRRVAARVTDADNLVASDELIVRIHVTPEDDDFPPVCRVKPWLPQCQDALQRVVGSRRREQP